MLLPNQNLLGHSENKLKYDIPRNLAYKGGLVYVLKHSCRACCQSRYERPYLHRKVIFEKPRIY